MTPELPDRLPSDFLDRLITQVDPHAVLHPPDLQIAKLLCGRWLALARLHRKYSYADLAQLVALSREDLALLEVGLGDRPSSPSQTWERLSQAYTDATHSQDWVYAVIAHALGDVIRVDLALLAQVQNELRTMEEVDPQIEPTLIEPGTTVRAATALWLAHIRQWINQHIAEPVRDHLYRIDVTLHDPTQALSVTLRHVEIASHPHVAALSEPDTAHDSWPSSIVACLADYIEMDSHADRLLHIPTRVRLDHPLAQAAAVNIVELNVDGPPFIIAAWVQGMSRRSLPLHRPGLRAAPSGWRYSKRPASYRHALDQFQSPIRPHTKRAEPAVVNISNPELVTEAIVRTPRLVLLGAPGSGKSALLHAVAIRAAQWFVDPASMLPQEWSAPKLPVLCALNPVGHVFMQSSEQNDVTLLWQQLLVQYAGSAPSTKQSDRFRQILQRGQAMLLFDGLDEVPEIAEFEGKSIRARVVSAIGRLGQSLPLSTSVVVTCRANVYREAWFDLLNEETHRSKAKWIVRTIKPLSPEQTSQMIAYQFARDQSTHSYEQHEIGQIQQNYRLRRLVQSPLSLTMLMGVPNTVRAQIDTTADLYNQYVTIHLRRTSASKLLRRTDDEAQMRTAIEALAFELQRASTVQTESSELQEDELLDRIARRLRLNSSEEITVYLQTCSDILRHQYGLLQPTTLTHHFASRSIQEFLSACWLTDAPDMLQQTYELWTSSGGDAWQEVILQIFQRVGQLDDTSSKGLALLQMFLSEYLPAGTRKPSQYRWRDTMLAADGYYSWIIDNKLGSLSSSTRSQIEAVLITKLSELVCTAGDLAWHERLRAGRYLGRLGDPRPGVATLQPDWCAIPVDLRMREAGYNADSFQIARYPVTNAQWLQFIESDGYSDPQWWGDAWPIRERAAWTHPRFWDVVGREVLNHPVTGISWYEAFAFCAWLTAQGRVEGWLSVDQLVRLPTEEEWKLAASGADSRRYPWGDTWDVTRTNTLEAGLGTTSPVGCYPYGASPYGAFDMSGNVAEWCHVATSADQANASMLLLPKHIRPMGVRRGGSWAEDIHQARCAARRVVPLDVRGNLMGFRVVAVLLATH